MDVKNETEIWKPIINYEGLYWASNFGNIRNRHGRILIQGINKNGYKIIGLSKNGVKKTLKVHKIIAKLFVENDDLNVNTVTHHIDGNRGNNNYKNLMWTTQEYNVNEPISIKRRTLNEQEVNNKVKNIHCNVTYVEGYKKSWEKCWWKCEKCGYTWESALYTLINGSGCPQCKN